MTEPLWEGDIFAGKYKVERVIGQGAMGMVIAARHLGLDEPVAIKVLLPAMLEMPGMVDRFIREARAAARIRGEHVVRVSDVDTLPNGVPFMVMERLEGMDLAEVCKTRGKLSIAEAARYVRQVLRALDDAHSLGVVHRDIKPGNLFLARQRDGSSIVKVLDFGISKLSHGDHIATRAGTVLGSPAYMSPEQMASAKDVDGRTDIWALGVVLYEMLTGELPFRAEALPQLCTAILHGTPAPPSSKRPELPAELEAIVLRCLEKDRERRFATARELAGALAPFESFTASAGAGTAVLPSLDAPRVENVTVPSAAAQSAPGTQSAPGAQSVPPPTGGSTQPNMSRSAAIVPPKRSPVIAMVGFGLALAAGVAIFMATRAPAPAGGVQATATHAAPPVTATAAPSEPAIPAPTAAPVAVTPASAEPSATAASSASATAAAKTVDPAHAPKPGSKGALKAPAPSAAPKPADAPGAPDPFQGVRK